MYKLPDTELWTGRTDSATNQEHFRHFQTIKFGDLTQQLNINEKQGVGLLGYAVDKGVELNKGRMGAKEGPDAIRKAFANLPDLSQCSICDYGNVEHHESQLILEEDDNTAYLVLGIQQGGNTAALFNYADAKGIQYVYADELLHQLSPPIKDKIERFIHHHDVIMFTICMDVIDSAFAPGVSATAVLGLYPNLVLEMAKRIIPSEKVSTISIAETNPQYDVDNRTAKLTANFFHHFIL